MGRDSEYTPEMGDRICELIATKGDDGKVRKLAVVAEELGISERSIYRWLARNEEFSQKYTRARETRADIMAEEIIEIADTVDDPHLGRLRMDARKWLAGKYNRGMYGDKVDSNITVTHEQKLAELE